MTTWRWALRTAWGVAGALWFLWLGIENPGLGLPAGLSAATLFAAAL